jgi:hypothetical protein
MDTKSKVLLGVFVFVLVAAIAATYYRSFVTQDYELYEGEVEEEILEEELPAEEGVEPEEDIGINAEAEVTVEE